jgi:hypothetical protein
MSGVRIFGVIIGLMLLLHGIYRRKTGEYRRVDFILVLLFSLGVVVVSISPATGNFLTGLLNLRNRLFAILVFSNLLLFGLFLYVLGGVNANRRVMGELIRALARREFAQAHLFDRADTESLIGVVVPAYNEAEVIEGILQQLPNNILSYKVKPIVVVDGAEDHTEVVVREAGYLVATHVMNRGQGGALRTGFDIALQQGADIVVTMDADGQHRPEDMERLVEPVIESQADFVMGSRFLGEYEGRGGLRHIGIVLFTALINLLSGVNITDCTNGFRAIRGSGLARLDLREDKFSAPELIMEAARKGLRIKEIPVVVKRRAAGTSKKPPRLAYPLGFLRTIVQTWLR